MRCVCKNWPLRSVLLTNEWPHRNWTHLCEEQLRTVQYSLLQIFFIHQLMHKWIVLKTILKFTLKFTKFTPLQFIVALHISSTCYTSCRMRGSQAVHRCLSLFVPGPSNSSGLQAPVQSKTHFTSPTGKCHFEGGGVQIWRFWRQGRGLPSVQQPPVQLHFQECRHPTVGVCCGVL
jgi:hypothetical protein